MDDRDEFSSFVASSSAALFRTAALLAAGDVYAAQDLMQDAYSETYRRWHRIEEPRAALAYTRRILVRTASRRWKAIEAHSSRLAPGELREHTIGHEEAVHAQQDLLAALRQLSPRQRAVVVLRYYEDLTEGDTAAILGCSVGAVKSHASRALRALRELLGSDDYLTGEMEGRP